MNILPQTVSPAITPNQPAGRLAIFLLLLATSLLQVAPAWAQLFSPGKLARVHTNWDSLEACGECHAPHRGKLNEAGCLACHKPLQSQIFQKAGWHGKNSENRTDCGRCHQEHRGRSTPLIPWPNGERAKFPHEKTGWSLNGAHAPLKCESCHEPRLIRTKEVIDYAARYQPPQTFLGLSRRCIECHFDEHRGALPKDCERCHDEKVFKKPPHFDHDKSYPLQGAHQRVSCEQCHPKMTDPAFKLGSYPAPKSRQFLKMKPIPHERCLDCHKDFHQGKFRPDCQHCHSLASWKLPDSSSPIEDRTFHDKTNYPLKGRHRLTRCEQCHLKNKSGQIHYRPIAHERCGDCHPNAHPNFSSAAIATRDCRVCHSEDGFLPASYDALAHQKSRYPLDGAHLAVPCPLCHLKPPNSLKTAPPSPSYVVQLLAPVRLSAWQMRFSTGREDLQKCATCHGDPHLQQFGKRPCQDCHGTTSWKIAQFNHTILTQYPLEGQHRTVGCPLCHQAETAGEHTFIRYRPLAKDCEACHQDIHYGQFQTRQPAFKCAKCHQTSGFTKLLFDHNDPTYADWKLNGQHAKVKCRECHPQIALTREIRVSRYRPSPKRCAGCHEDYHQGVFARASAQPKALHPTTPTQATQTSMMKAAPATMGVTGLVSPSSPSLEPNQPGCETCHNEQSFKNARFDHDQTHFPLRGAHARQACERCHKRQMSKTLPTVCAGCHQDPHQGKLGNACQACHDEQEFRRSRRLIAEHYKTRFPLSGKHAIIACSECHPDTRDIGFDQTPTACVACHAHDIPTASSTIPDHSGFGAQCQECHTTFGWQSSKVGDHELCFPIKAGNHAQIACGSCHISGIPQAVKNCSSGGFTCITCHGCDTRQHEQVANFRCNDAQCYQCHPRGR